MHVQVVAEGARKSLGDRAPWGSCSALGFEKQSEIRRGDGSKKRRIVEGGQKEGVRSKVYGGKAHF